MLFRVYHFDFEVTKVLIIYSFAASTTVLTAQIKVARIARIEISSRFRQVSRGDTLHLQVRAYDAEGNVFSSLDGLRFDW